MRDELLRQLLRRVDASATTTNVPMVGLADSVRGQAARRQRRRRIAAAALIVIGLSVQFEVARHLMQQQGATAVVIVPSEVESLQSIEIQRRYHEETALAVLARIDRTKTSTAAASVIEPFSRSLQQQRNEAALILLDQGDRARVRFNDSAAATAAYRDAIRLFPESPAAVAAGQRLRGGDATSQPGGGES
jgi:hypothetical protein